MKLQTTFQTIFLAFITLTIISISGCKKDDEPLAREKFLGTYNVNENCSSGTDTYSFTITESTSNESSIVISNFYGFGFSVRATISSSGTEVTYNENQSGVNFSGSGSISGNTLTLIFTASEAGNTNDCTATAIKQ